MRRWPDRRWGSIHANGRLAIDARFRARLRNGLPNGWRRTLRPRRCAAIEIRLRTRLPNHPAAGRLVDLPVGGLGPLHPRRWRPVDTHISWQFSASRRLWPGGRLAGHPFPGQSFGTLDLPCLLRHVGGPVRLGRCGLGRPSLTLSLSGWQGSIGLSRRAGSHRLRNLGSRPRQAGVLTALFSAPPR